MDTTNASNPLQQLGAANRIAIADLTPEIQDSASRAVRGVVTITWPYNSVKGTFAFILAEPDYRLRRSKGQVRINLNGASAKAAGESGLSSGDEVLVSLDGAEWEPEQTKKRQSLPGAGIDWQLKFSDKLILQVILTETGETKLVNVDRPPPAEPQPRAETPPTEISHEEDLPAQILETLTPPSKTYIAKLKDGEFESPAFVKRARMSYGSLFEDGYDIFEDDGGVKGRGRKRSRFGRESGAWKYTSQSPSPEPTSPQAIVSSPPRPDMTDEGCQTMEIDLPMPLPTQENSKNEAQLILESTSRVEDATHPQQGMVDHGVQGDLHSEWPVATPTPLPPPGPSSELPSSGPELSAFQAADGFNIVTDDLQRWNAPPLNLPPEGYLHTTEPPSANGFSNTFEIETSVGHDIMRPGSRTHSPNEPNHLAVEHDEHHLNEGPATDEQGYPIHATLHSTDYPPLGLEDEEESTTVPQVAHMDYPPSYLDSNHPFSQEETMDIERDSFDSSVPAAEIVGSSSWATVNNPSQATSMPHTGRLGSAEGESPDTAVVIDESDSDDEPPPPTATEDTVMTGQADALEMYEEAEVEDDVDAEYSDDDEPEYDADEMGGDYDTRNYTAPDDDEDDSHDEDLGPRELEPEFDDGESWDEEDEDAENLEYESEYETDDNNEENRKPVRPVSQSIPQVIDLISSSEDEGEDDEATQPRQAARPVAGSISQSQPATSPGIISKQALVQPAESGSESEEDSEDSLDNEEKNDEEDEEGGKDIEREDVISSVDSIDKPDSESSGGENEDVERMLEEELEEAALSPGDDDVAESIDMGSQQLPAVSGTSRPNEFTVHKKTSPEPSHTGLMGTKTKEEYKDGNDRQSAADGLDLLGRVVESEWNDNHVTSPREIQDEDAIDTMPAKGDEPLAERIEVPEEQVEGHESLNSQEDEEMVDMVPILPATSSTPQPVAVDEERQVETTAPSSPPLTHSFISLSADDKKMDVVLRENIAVTGPRLPADQLPTPRDTQLTGDITVLDSVAVVSMDVDEPDVIDDTTGLSPVAEQLASRKPPSVAAEDIITNVEEQPTERSTVQSEKTHLEEISQDTTQRNNLLASPSLSFQTQVAAEEMVPASFVEPIPEITIELETGTDTRPDIETSISRASLSFISQMEVDEELQASIMENSEFDDDTDTEVVEERGIRYQVEEYEYEGSPAQSEDDVRTELESQSPVSRDPSPDLGTQIQEQRDTGRTNSADIEADSPEQASQTDPSVQLARIAYAFKRRVKNHDANKITPADEINMSAVERSSPGVEDSSVQLARASLTRSSQGEEESYSMTAAKLKLVRHLRDELPDCTPLKVLRQHLQKKLDVIAVAMMHPPDPQRAKGGPREFMMSFTITDHSIGPYLVVEAQLYRPHKETLPIVKAGDVVLLRNFTVISLQGKGFGLRTNDESSWAIFDQDSEPPQIKGPPVEYGERETTYVAHMRAWYNLLDEKARLKLERANKKIIDAGKSK
ncbi:uncharacterized protein F4817DRAFT_323351 [Daldinia loculata]|uniref:uncharacterized protein n=1 Tax=Daldinia loculata TaxID=103429 RepID=UPI0020C2F0FA|nr:uncharacterized protein F4817DRAFT_323351 [Daldinia loculata]KAI1651706.1 hypothetical protein F4817DRAFT_323351 [Daldinia loculata]